LKFENAISEKAKKTTTHIKSGEMVHFSVGERKFKLIRRSGFHHEVESWEMKFNPMDEEMSDALF
jgi:hypothetical protein